MCQKIRYAVKARHDPDFVIGARTDAVRTHGFAEAVRRANLYADAGADIIVIFPSTVEEVKQAPKEIRCHLMINNSEGTRSGRPILPVQELEAMGYKMVKNVSVATTVFNCVKELFVRLRETGRSGLDQTVHAGLRKEIEDLIGLNEYYRVEEETVEKVLSP